MEHPILPCGYNADDNNGDEVDGAGTNWPIWPSLFDTFEGFIPLIVTDEMLEEFETTCSDVSFAWEINSVEFPFELMDEMILDDWAAVAIDGQSDALALAGEMQTQAIRRGVQELAIVGKSDTLALPGKSDVVLVPEEVQTQHVRPDRHELAIVSENDTLPVPDETDSKVITGKNDTLPLPDEADTVAIRKAG